MSAIALTGNDVVTINGTILSDFADGDIAVLDFPHDIANVKTGKNGNALYAYDAQGQQGDLKLRVIRASADDKFLNGLLVAQDGNFQGTTLLTGELVKSVGNGEGVVTADTYLLSGGIITKLIPAKSNVDGDVQQSVSEYTIKFSKAIRAIT